VIAGDKEHRVRAVTTARASTPEPNDIAYDPETSEVWLRGVEARLHTR
jgi:hypothetical protein